MVRHLCFIFVIIICNSDLHISNTFLKWENRNGVQQRKTSWQDGVLGTNCPIPPNSQWTYHMQVKDQIGTFSYFPSTGMHRAVGGFGGFNIQARPVIFVPYLKPAAEFTLLISDWWKSDHKVCNLLLFILLCQKVNDFRFFRH